jgi:hypothetical protein
MLRAILALSKIYFNDTIATNNILDSFTISQSQSNMKISNDLINLDNNINSGINNSNSTIVY